MNKKFRTLLSILSAVMLSVPLVLSGQHIPKMGLQDAKEHTSGINKTAGVRAKSPDMLLNPRDFAEQEEQFSYIRNSFIAARDPFQAMKSATDGIEFIGWVYFSKTGEGMSTDAHHGLYSFTLDDTFTPLDEYIGEYFDGGMAGLYIDGTYHYYYTSTVTWPTLQYKHRVYNTEAGWTYFEENITNEQTPRALCSNGEVSYGCFFTGEYDSSDSPMFVFGKFNHETSEHTTIAPLPKMWVACAYGADGYVYAIDKSGYLQKTDIQTGTMTSIGWTGCNPTFASDAVIDIKSGRMFWAVGLASGYGKMYEVNLSTGNASELVSFRYGDHIVGLNILNQAWGAAPAAVENLSSNFTDDSLSGTITFTAPTMTYDGNTLSGDLSYTLNIDGEQNCTGTCQAGENVSIPLTFDQAGSHVISVSVSNQEGSGPRETLRTFIGKDTPATPEVTISYANGKFTVTWNAVTETVNGGYMDPSKITYKVTRMPENVVVAEAITETSLVDEVGEPSTNVPYFYTVQASWEGIQSGIGTSNIIGIGSIFPPYLEEFTKVESLDGFTIINSNNDSQTWTWYYTYVRCKYGTGKMDDWLISPAVRLEAGKSYFISIDAKAHNSDYPERLEIKVGREATAEGMTETLVGPTEISQTYPYVTIGDYFECTETGDYYVGIHGISDARMFYLNIDNLSIGAGIGDESPAVVEDFTATTDPSGDFNAVITGKAPTTTESGDELKSLSKIDIYRDGNKITTIAPIRPGTEFSYTDIVGNKGTYTYSAIATNEKGSSKEVKATTNVGFAVPSKVSDIQLTETAPGIVSITWTAPTTDVEETPLGNSRITYKIVNALSTSEVYAENIEGTSYTYNIEGDSQKFFAVGVIATNYAGDSEIKYSDIIAAGEAYGAPYKESFANGSAWSILGTKGYDGSSVSWSTRNDSSIEGVASSDGDNGYISCKFQYSEDKSMLFTGKIDLGSSEHPFVSVDIFNRHGSEYTNADNNYLEIVVSEANGNDWQVLKEGTFTDFAGDDFSKWVTVSADLEAYKGKTIQVGLRASCYAYALALFDDLRVGDLSANDLAITTLTAPTVVKPNQEFEINAIIKNKGYQTAENYTVEFYRGTNLIESQEGIPVDANATQNFTLKQTLGLSNEDANAEYRCKVVFANDANLADNETTATVIRAASEKPAPTNLSAEDTGNGIYLTWTAPNTDGPMTDEFEGEESWAYENVGDWTFVDADQGPIGGFQGMELPNNPSESNRAFFVFDNSDTELFNETYAMHSGNKCLTSMFLLSGDQCDDWAISPELDGSEQTISFWARSYSPQYPEHIEILYSTTGKETSDFIKIDENSSVSSEWTEYTVNVPEGTKYFAIRSCATDAFMLMIDDVTYMPANAAPIGYNVYRNGARINESPVTGNEFTDTMTDTGLRSYFVTAVYHNNRESDPSNEATVDVSGIGAANATQQITTGHGFIKIAGAEGFLTTINAVNGYVLYNDIPSSTIEVKLVSGIYLVRIGNKTTKVCVK